MKNKIKAGIYTILVLVLIGLISWVVSMYPRTMLIILLAIAFGGFVYSIYRLIYYYLDGKEEDPIIF